MRQHVALGWIVLVEHISFSPLGEGTLEARDVEGDTARDFMPILHQLMGWCSVCILLKNGV